MGTTKQDDGQNVNDSDKPQSYGTCIIQKSDQDVRKPISYGTQVVNESDD